MVRDAFLRSVGAMNAHGQVDVSPLRQLCLSKTVLVKPNWVKEEGGACTHAVTTHASVLRPIIDEILSSCDMRTQVVVADTPLQSADLDAVWRQSGVEELRAFYSRLGAPVSFLDLRPSRVTVSVDGFIQEVVNLSGDPRGYAMVSLGPNSALEAITTPTSRFSVTDYEPGDTQCRHKPGQHAYYISNTVLHADVIVNVPKLKTHIKAGMTACMKNMIGINADKSWIPHYRLGPPGKGGDEYPEAARSVLAVKNMVRNIASRSNATLYAVLARTWRHVRAAIESGTQTTLTAGGAWQGNDTLWRSIHDLVRISLYADKLGVMMSDPQRVHLCVVDAIIAGEGRGPLTPQPIPLGAIIAASNPIPADLTCARLSGINRSHLPQLAQAGNLASDMGLRSAADTVIRYAEGGRDHRDLRLDVMPTHPFALVNEWKAASITEQAGVR